MAGTLGTATLETEVDLDGLDSGLDSADGNTKGRLSSLAGDVTNLLGGIVVGAAALAVGAVAAIGVTAIDVSSQFAQATNMIQTQLGLSEQDAQEFGEVIEDVWGNNFGGSVEEVGAAVATVQQQIGDFGDLTHEEIGAATEDAFRLSDAFGIDIAESTNAVGALMENFGLTADEAFDFVTAGIQRGLNTSGDFLDTITEYSTQFGNAGADAGQFFSLLESGLGSGMLGTDKAADAFKEFNVRILDGSDTTRDALALLGLSIDDITEGINNGSITQADAFQMVIDKLGEQEDAALQYQTGVALLGGQFEDLGVEAVLALDLMGNQLDNVAGATDSLDAQYNNWPSMWEGIKRTVLLAIKPIGDALLNIANMIMPYVTQALGWFETNLAPAITDIATKIQTFAQTFISALESGSTPIEAFKTALASIVSEETMAKITPVIDWIQDFIGKVQEFVDQHSVELQGAITAIGVALGAAGIATLIGGIVAAIGALLSPIGLVMAAVALLGAAWAGNWGDIQGKTYEGIANIQAAVDSFKAFWEVFAPWFDQNVVQVWAGNIENMRVIWDEGKANIEELIDNFKLTWDALVTWFDENVVQVWSGNIDNLVTIWTDGKQNIEDLLDGFKLTWDSVVTYVKGLLDGLATGIGNVVSAIDSLITWIGNLATAVANFDLGALVALLSQSPPPLAVGIKWVGDEMDTFTRGSLTALQRKVDAVPALSTNRLQIGAMNDLGPIRPAFASSDMPSNDNGQPIIFDFRNSVIASKSQLKDWIKEAMLENGIRANTRIMVR